MKKCFCVVIVLLLLAGCGTLPQDGQTMITLNPNIDMDNVPEFSDLLSLRDYLNEKRLSNELEFAFRFTGKEDLTGDAMTQMTATSFIKFYTVDDIFCVTLVPHCGDRVAAAHFNGGASALSADEQKALEIAENMVETAKSKVTDEWELELLIHDMLAQHITYYDTTVGSLDPENMPRHLTVVGALVDGKANCQGYADAFYTVATIAGFTVDRMSVVTPDAPHMANTVLLDGQWYVVDVTFDDNDADSKINYRLFNAGLDAVCEYTWDPINEIHPLAPVCDDHYYYKHQGIYYEDMEVMADAVAGQWAKNGKTEFDLMLANETDGDIFKDVLYEALSSKNKSFAYTYSYFTNGKDTFYSITIE